MNRIRNTISGASAIRLALLVVMLILGAAPFYGDRRAHYLYLHAYDRVLETKASDNRDVLGIIGRAPTETDVHGKLFIEKYVFRSPLGRKYIYFAVYQNGDEPRALLHQYRDELPYWLTAKAPDLPTYSEVQRPPDERDVAPLDDDQR